MLSPDGPDHFGQIHLSSFARFYRVLMVATGAIAAIMFASMAILVCVDVLLRNLGIATIAWTVEATEYMLMISAFLAAPWLVYTNDHIRVDILVRGLPRRMRWLAAVLGDVTCLLVCAALAFQSIYSTLDSARQGGLVFKVLIFPDWWLSVPMVICFVLLVIEFLRRLIRTTAHPEAV